MEPKTHQEESGKIADDDADLKDATTLELKINRLLVKIQKDTDEILRLQMRVKCYRQEMHRLALKRSEKLTLRLKL